MLSRVKTRISAYWNKSPQNWWFFAISHNIGVVYFPLKCGGFLEFSHCPQFTTLLSQAYPLSKLYFE
jgi:hypothetical protein